MLAAFLKAKLSREQTNMEDILTSTVFGLLRYLPESHGILPFLRQAVPFVPGNNLKASLPATADVVYDFWPGWSETGCQPCEPDIVLRMADRVRAPILLCIEAKYRSGKSAGPKDRTDPGDKDVERQGSSDQLAKEWENLHVIATSAGCYPVLIYLTADFGPPMAVMAESVDDCRDPEGMRLGLHWLSWRHLISALGAQDSVSEDLRCLLRRFGLLPFGGITPLAAPRVNWHFDAAGDCPAWAKAFPAHSINWRFEQ